MSYPADGVWRFAPRIVDANGGDLASQVLGDPVFDLEAAGGKLYGADYDNDQVRRLTPAKPLVSETTVNAPAGSGPDGIAVDGAGTVWVTLYNIGQSGGSPRRRTAAC